MEAAKRVPLHAARLGLLGQPVETEEVTPDVKVGILGLGDEESGPGQVNPGVRAPHGPPELVERRIHASSRARGGCLRF